MAAFQQSIGGGSHKLWTADCDLCGFCRDYWIGMDVREAQKLLQACCHLKLLQEAHELEHERGGGGIFSPTQEMWSVLENDAN